MKIKINLFSLKLIAPFTIALVLLFVILYTHPKKIYFTVDEQNYEFTLYSDSLPGEFYLTPRNSGRDQQFGRLLIFDQNAHVNYFKKISTLTKNMTYDFKRNLAGLKSYFVIEANSENWGQRNKAIVSFHLLDKNNAPIDSPVIPAATRELDMHDVMISRAGNYFFIYYKLDPLKNKIDAEIKGIDPSGKVIFNWTSNELFKTEKENSTISDYLHANSIFEDHDGGLILSFNQIGTIIKINYPEGKLIWKFSKKDWQFINDDQNGFSYQHSPILVNQNTILMYDNAGNLPNESSRAVEYELNFEKKIARLVWQFKAEKPFNHRNSLGAIQRLSNGNTLISWGATEQDWQESYYSKIPLFTEVNSKNKKVRELNSLSGQVSYRAYFDDLAK